MDGGADFSLVSNSVGEVLGFERPPKPPVRISGIGKEFILAHPIWVWLTIGPYRVRARVAWAERDGLPLLLGRTDVFDYFKVEYDQRSLVNPLSPL